MGRPGYTMAATVLTQSWRWVGRPAARSTPTAFSATSRARARLARRLGRGRLRLDGLVTTPPPFERTGGLDPSLGWLSLRRLHRLLRA